MRITAKLQEMAASEIAGMIPQADYDAIKLTDPHPLFKAFVVGHEGESKGDLVGVGNVVKRWYRAAIEKLHSRITAGLQLFHGHSGSDDPASRVPIGEVCGKKLMDIAGKLSSVVAVHVFPVYKNLALDVASVEADVELDVSADGVRVVSVGPVTAIALGSSSIETPGFAGATLLGQLQAFVPTEEEEKLSPYLDPRRNPFIRLSGDEVPEPAAKETEGEKELDPALDPAQNPYIRLD
jgi:hypothetical protein